MDNIGSKVSAPLSILAAALGLGAAPNGASASEEWSPAAFASARASNRPVLALVTDAEHAAEESAWRAEPSVAERLARDFVDVRVDRLVRPDVADALALAVRERTGDEGALLLAVLSAEAVPCFGVAGARALDPAVLAEAASAAAACAAAPDERWTKAVEAVRAAQRPSPAQRPLDAATVEAVTRAAIGSPALARTDGPLPSAAILLLLDAHARARRPEVLKLAATALDLRLARSAAPPSSVAEEAVALATWARAHDVAGRAVYGEEAERVAARLRARRLPDGCLPESASDARVVAQTNGLAIAALARAGRVAGRAADVDAARAAATCVLARLGPAAALTRADGAPKGGALLDDHAALVDGLVELYDATGDARWRTAAQAVADAAIGRFLDVEGGGFFLTDAAHEPSLARAKTAFDGALPSANGTMAQVLPRLARATGEPRYAELARRTVDAFLGDLQRAPRALLTLGTAAAALVAEPAPARADPAAPAVVTRGRVTLHARPPAVPAAPGGTVEIALELEVAPGAFVLAHGVRAKDLAGLGVSVPSAGVRAVAPQYPIPATERPSWSADPLSAYVGRTTIPVRVTLERGAAVTSLRLRVLFQECDASACRTPDGAVLEVPVAAAPVRP